MIINDTQFNADLSDILNELSLQLAQNHIQLLQKIRETSKDIMVQCPYHGNGRERKPSAGFRRSDGQFHCFACGEVHSLPEVISFCFGKHDDLFGAFGWSWLVKNFATVSIEERKPIELELTRCMNKPIEPKYVSEKELDKYRYYHSYWKKRGITDERIIELFDLGYDKETDCITMPVRDRFGHTLFIARRSVKTKYFNYPEGVEKPLYGLFEIYQLEQFPKEIIVCESMIDALTAWQYGKYAVAMNGLGTEYQFRQLRELPCRKLILATDNDKAGLEARKRIKKHVSNKIITEYLLPEGKKDLNELDFQAFGALEEIF